MGRVYGIFRFVGVINGTPEQPVLTTRETDILLEHERKISD